MLEFSVKPGRRRSAAAQAAVLEAAFDLVVARGYDGLSIEGVAQSSGVAKTTIYRWWESKAELAVEAFFRATEHELRLPETDDPRADFRAQILDLAALLRGERGRALAGMLGGGRSDETLARALNERWLGPRRRWGFERMSRAASEGRLRTGVEVGPALSLLYGPVYTPLLFGEPPPDHPTMERILAIALSGIFRDDGATEDVILPV